MPRAPEAHRTAERRSIALHEAVAAAIADDPAVVDRARARVAAWLQDGGPVDRARAGEWQDLLGLPTGQLRARLIEDTEQMRDLRQNTPFAGVVKPRERWRIVREVR